jgi:rare lipoprotein A
MILFSGLLTFWYMLGQVDGKNTGFDEGIVSMSPEIRKLKSEIAGAEIQVVALDESLRIMRKMLRHEATASWYGADFHDRPTASSEIFDMEAMTAASLWIPIGSTWSVECPETGRAVIVRINDRGPYVVGRSIDLSLGAARALGFEHAGLAQVFLTPVVVPGK